MKSQRIVRVNELIRREIAANMQQFAHGTDVDMAGVTITRVAVSSNLRTARVWVSVLENVGTEPSTAPEGDQPEARADGLGANASRILTLLLNRRGEIQAHLARTLKIKYTPRLYFEIDDSLLQGDKVLSLLDSLSEDAGMEPPGEDEDA